MSAGVPPVDDTARDLAKIVALMRVSERVTLEGPALANVLAELDEAARLRAMEQRAREVAEYRVTVMGLRVRTDDAGAALYILGETS